MSLVSYLPCSFHGPSLNSKTAWLYNGTGGSSGTVLSPFLSLSLFLSLNGRVQRLQQNCMSV